MKEKLPILMVAPRKEDFKPNVPMGNTTFLGEYTEKIKENIISQCSHVKSEFEKKTKRHNNIPCIGKVIMKKDAIAKTHKPNNLFSNNTCPIIGTGKLNEIYIKITEEGLNNLENEIKNVKAETKKAEMTKIEKIETYSETDVIRLDLERNSEPLKIKLFDFRNEEENRKNKEEFLKLIQELGLDNDIKKIDSYKTMDIYLLESKELEKIKLLAEYQGVKTIDTFQKYSLVNPKIRQIEEKTFSFPKPIDGKDYPIIGLIDSGISINNSEISPWIYEKEELIPEAYQNNKHGTFIAGIMLFGEGLNINGAEIKEPNFKILDVVAIPNSDPDFGPIDTLSEEVFLEMLENIMKKYSSKVKVWNISLGTNAEVGEIISDFAVELDRIQDEYEVQFFIAAGNYGDKIRKWPVEEEHNDRITTPADSVRGITVGAIALDDGVVKKNEPSPFSRRGPGANYINKPDIVDYGGNINEEGFVDGCGIVSFDIEGNYIEGIGTSYSTPFAVVKYQNILDNISDEYGLELAKALLIHSCINPVTREIGIEDEDMKYFGFGIAESNLQDVLKCDNTKVTMIVQGKIRTGEHIEIEDIPYPESLKINGKWYGKILATLVYNPILDPREGQEYCRSNIDFSMGLHRLDKKTGELKYKGEVPLEKRWDEKFESQRVEHGAKWAPSKRHFRHIARGLNGQDWKIRLDCTNRNQMGMVEQPFTLVITIDSENDESDIYTEMVTGLRNQGFSVNNLQLRSDIQLRN